MEFFSHITFIHVLILLSVPSLVVAIVAVLRSSTGAWIALGAMVSVPLLLGVAGTALGYRGVEMAITASCGTPTAEDIAWGRAVAREPLYLGLIFSVVLAVIAAITASRSKGRPTTRKGALEPTLPAQ